MDKKNRKELLEEKECDNRGLCATASKTTICTIGWRSDKVRLFSTRNGNEKK
jgi:hypothetical protein